MGGLPYTTEFGHGLIDAERALMVAASLNATEQAPLLRQAGGPHSEGSFAGASTLGSGCQTITTNSYCTVWMKDSRSLYDRYLPYSLSSGPNLAGWTWATSLLNGSGDWSLRAVQGELQSTPYILSSK